MKKNMAGRDLDALIAKEIFKCKIAKVQPGSKDLEGVIKYVCDCDADENGDRPHDRAKGDGLKYYSEDLSAAWEVLAELEKRDFYFLINGKGDKVVVDLGQYQVDVAGGRETYSAAGESTPHAICLAALKAVGFEAHP